MLKVKAITGIFFLILIVSSQRIGSAPCPSQYEFGSAISARITISQQRGIVPLIRGQDVQFYNYSLPYSFARIPSAAIAIHDFHALPSDNIFFSIKPIKSESRSYLPLLIRTHWKYTSWEKISFSILVEDRLDLQCGYYQIDSGSLGGSQPGKQISVILPFRQIGQDLKINHNLFLHGFQISSQEYALGQKSPTQIQVINSVTNTSGISVVISVRTITQVHAIHISYIAWSDTNLNLISGKYSQDIMNVFQISHIPQSNIGRNYARIFGLTGFIINNNNQDLFFMTNWTGSKFVYEFDVSLPFLQYISFEYLFFLGSQCSDCPGYNLIFNGTCRQFCPQGYHATGQQVCIDCGDGHFWNGTACMKECATGQILNFITNQCQCPIGLHWNGIVCLSCQSGKIFNKEKKKCQCPGGTRWNGFGCATMQVCENGRQWNVFKFMCQCPTSSYWNGNVCVKIITCTNGRIPDGNNGCKCSENTYWNGQYCAPHGCFGGQQWNGTACNCQIGYNFNGTICLLCINGQEWDNISKTCICPINYSWNGNFCEKNIRCSGGRKYNKTVDQCLCQSGSFWNGFSCMIIPDCGRGKIWNQTTFQCNCPSSFNWDGTNCVLCMNGKIWNQNSQQCECREGTKWMGQYCVVIQQCFGGTIWNQNTWSCECPAVMVWNGNYCIANPCQGGRIWDNFQRRCLCPEGTRYINNICQRPRDICREPKIYDQQSQTCVCPQGFFDNKITCVLIAVCQGNQFRNLNNNKCQCPSGLVKLYDRQCADPTCPANKIWDGYGCVNISCPPNSYYNGSQCVSPDPADRCRSYEYYDGIRCVSQPTMCPDGSQWNGTNCIPLNCPAGFYAIDQLCLPLPQRCVPPTYWANNRCQIVDSCPHGSFFRSGNCVPYVACAQGQSWDNNLVNCVCPDGTQWNGQKCLACTGGKIWQPFKGCECPTGYYDTGRCEKLTQTRCALVDYAIWDGLQCVCHEGFDVIGLQCVCEGVVEDNRCNKCAHKPNSQWRYGFCRCKLGYIDQGGECIGNSVGNDSAEDCNVATFFDHQQSRCLPCPAGCLECKSSYKCDRCSIDFNFEPISQLCTEHCGDGRRYIVECDDGNNLDSDGCSSSCRIEQGYVCTGGSPNSMDNCKIYQPQQLTLIQTGQIRYYSKIIVNIKLDYLPKALLQSSDCSNRCSNILDGKLISGDKDAISIKSSYLPGSNYAFSVQVEFGRKYIGQFSIQIQVNQHIASKYFNDVDTSRPLTVLVNPAILAKVQQGQQLV